MPTTVIASAKTINPIRAGLLTAKHLPMQAFATCTNDIAASTITKRSCSYPTTTKVPVPFVVVFDANGRPSHAMRLNLNCSLNISISAYPQQLFVSRSAYEAVSFHRSQRHRHSRHTHRDALPYRHHALFFWYRLALRSLRDDRRRLACHLALLCLPWRVLRICNSHRKLAVQVTVARQGRRMLPLFLP